LLVVELAVAVEMVEAVELVVLERTSQVNLLVVEGQLSLH
jgi:hypothetical protein